MSKDLEEKKKEDEPTKDEMEFIEALDKTIKRIEKIGLDCDVTMPMTSEEFKKLVEI